MERLAGRYGYTLNVLLDTYYGKLQSYSAFRLMLASVYYFGF
jgi:hypothetical protein